MGDLVLVGIAASIGFTVSLFFATAAFPAATHWHKRKWARS
jgi:Na+/H+ antiporter NhaA